MSMVFSDPTNKTGIVEKIDDLCGSSSDSYPIANKTRDINLGLDRVFDIIFQTGGRWNFDDGNHEKSPIISTDLILGQRDYSFTEDQQGNLILEIFKVMIADKQGLFHEIYPIDVQSEYATQEFYNGQEITGIATRYDKTGNSIFLNWIPDYNMRLDEEGTAGLKMYIDREASYFNVDDTTKKAGFAGLYHKYLALYAAHEYAESNQLTVAVQLGNDIAQMEKDIEAYYGSRARDERPKFKQRITPFK